MSMPYIADLIQIRNYIVNAVNNFSIPKTDAKDLQKMLTVLDKKIVEQILSDDFKEIIGFNEIAERTFKEVVTNSNIKSGMKKIEPAKVPVVAATGGKAQQLKPEPI